MTATGAFPYVASHWHGLATHASYVVRRTNLATLTTVEDDLATPDYGAALKRAQAIRAEDGPAWAVIDTVHSCGCRIAG